MANLFNKKIPQETEDTLISKAKKLKKKHVKNLRPVFKDCMESVFDKKQRGSGAKIVIPFPVKPLLDLELIILCNDGSIHINNNIYKGKLRVRDVILELCKEHRFTLKGLSIQIDNKKKAYMNIYAEV